MALGADYRLTPEVAADAIDEWLERIAVEANAESSPLDAGQTMHLHATDDGLGAAGEWTITGTRRDRWSHEHGKGDVALRGQREGSAAGDRAPTAGGRRRTSRYSVTPRVWEGWLDRTPF